MEIPSPGFGTWQITDPERCRSAVSAALNVGYRHVDAAQRYDNESAVGAGIQASAVPRDEVFLATKVIHPRVTDDYGEAGIRRDAEACLDRLGLDYVDLLYVHWPAAGYDPETTFRAFGALVEAGLVEAVGVCNFTPSQLEAAVAASPVPIAAHQFEFHPLLQQADVLERTRDLGMTPVGHTPLVHGDVTDVDALAEIAAKHDATPAQVALDWARERGVVPIPKAASEAHIRENWASRQVSLDDGDLVRIADLDEGRRIADPPFAPDW